jgi:hypothetical protein
VSTLRKGRYASLALLALLALSGLLLPIAKGQQPLSQVRSSDAALQDLLAIALRNVEELRKKNRATSVDCTPFFAEFNRHQQIEQYIAFFNSLGIPALFDNINRNKNYVAFELNDQRLWSLGYKTFLRGDRVVISFELVSASSNEITSFSATLLNSEHL